MENPMDRGAWWAIVNGVAKSQTQLSNSALKCVGMMAWVEADAVDF